jgi:hypothetical protein
VKTVEDDRMEIIGKYVEKEEDGKTWKKKEGVDNWDIPEDKMPEVSKEYAELMNEEWVLDVADSNREILQSVRNILLNTDYLFGPGEETDPTEINAKIRQMNDYPLWCEAFENLDLA